MDAFNSLPGKGQGLVRPRVARTSQASKLLLWAGGRGFDHHPALLTPQAQAQRTGISEKSLPQVYLRAVPDGNSDQHRSTFVQGKGEETGGNLQSPAG